MKRSNRDAAWRKDQADAVRSTRAAIRALGDSLHHFNLGYLKAKARVGRK
jgi:hypothetical protein